jgi:two-component system sensor histidine kinase AlgZ
VALAFWTAFSAAHVALNEVARLTAPEPYARRTWLLAIVVTAGWFWAAATPLVLRLAERLAPARVGLARSLAGHAGAALALALANAGVRHLVRHALAPDAPASLALVAAVNLDANLIAYVTLVGVGRALALHRDYTERAAHLLVLHSQLSRARLQFLQRQLRPHFLFNALNAVAELAREAPAAAERALGQLQRLLRSALASEGEPEVTLRDELAALAPFVEIQRMRFGDALAVEYDVDPGVLDALVPSLVLQPLVENAVRHAVAPSREPVTVGIEARVEADMLRVTVWDDGRAGAAPPGCGVGLPNVRDRLAARFGDAAHCASGPRGGGGFAVTLTMPAERA